MSDVTRIINALRGGSASDDDLPLAVYEDLRRIAIQRMRLEAPGHTLQPTALVHEAWLRLLASGGGNPFDNRRHFFAAAAEAMRRILVESARRRRSVKRGGHLARVDLDSVDLPSPLPDEEILALHDTLDRFAGVHPQAAEVVKLCYFVGFTQAEAAEVLGVSVATVERLWAFSRAWLFREIEKSRPPGPESPPPASSVA